MPRRNLALFGIRIYHDEREMFYRQIIRGSRKDPKYALRALEWIAQVNGYPKKAGVGHGAETRQTRIILTTRDGQETEMLAPARTLSPGSAQDQADEALLLAGQVVVPNRRQ